MTVLRYFEYFRKYNVSKLLYICCMYCMYCIYHMYCIYLVLPHQCNTKPDITAHNRLSPSNTIYKPASVHLPGTANISHMVVNLKPLYNRNCPLMIFTIICCPNGLSLHQILMLTMKNALPDVLRFLVCASVFYFGFTLCGWLVLGPYHMKVRAIRGIFRQAEYVDRKIWVCL